MSPRKPSTGQKGRKVPKRRVYNDLDKLEIAISKERRKELQEQKLKKPRYTYAKSQKQLGKTRMQKAVRERKRLPPPVPKNKSLSEIQEIPAEAEDFVVKASTGKSPGQPRKWVSRDGTPLVDPDTLSWRDKLRFKEQQKRNADRARVRKYEAMVIAAYHELEKHVSAQGDGQKLEVYDEDYAIAQGVLSMDDWDDEELIRGYRRARSGKFGMPPKYIPREIQQEAFRRLVGRGERRMRQAYIESVEGLINLAHNASSEKVRLEAQKELMNRVVGKVPDKVMIAHEQPWEHMLADSMVPLSEVDPLEMEVDEDGVARLPFVPFSDNEDVGGESAPSGDAARQALEPSPPPTSSVQREPNQVKAKDRPERHKKEIIG